MKVFNKVGLAIVKNKKVLTTREIDSAGFYFLPGGRIEGGETDIQALEREILEELGVQIKRESIKYLDVFEDVTTTDPNARVSIKLFIGDVIGEPSPSNEIEEIGWFGRDDDWSKLGIIDRNKIFPALKERELI